MCCQLKLQIDVSEEKKSGFQEQQRGTNSVLSEQEMAPLAIHSLKTLRSIDVFLVFLSEVYCKIWLHFSVFQVMSESSSSHNKSASLLLVQIYLQYNSERSGEPGGKYQLSFLR